MSYVLALMITAAAVLFTARAFPAGIQRWVALCGALHLVGALAQVWVTSSYYAGGDLLMYYWQGDFVARTLWAAPDIAWREVGSLLLQQPSMLDRDVTGSGSATGSMVALSGIALHLLGGSLLAACTLASLAGFMGSVLVLAAMLKDAPAHTHQPLAIAVLLLPSVVFWSSALLKETLAILGLGLIIFAFRAGFLGRAKPYLAFLAPGILAVGLFKPYLLFPCALALGVWFFFHRGAERGTPVLLRPWQFLVATALAVGGVVALGEVFPQFALDNVMEEAARLQTVGLDVDGGSNYQLGTTQRGLVGQLVSVPLALLTTLFRPGLWEARNVMMLATALETTALTVLAVRAAWHSVLRPSQPAKEGVSLVAFALTFVIVTGIAVGLASTNLGTLARYRAPLMPMFAALLVLRQPASVATAVSLART